MKVLVLSCNTGEGHNAAGRAVHEKFLKMGIECAMADTLAIAGKKVSKAVDDTYVGITTSSPKTFGAIYSIGRAVSDFNNKIPGSKSPVYAANVLYRKKLAAYINDGGYDVIVNPHLFPAECLTSLHHRKMLDTPFINIATDYACIPFWDETRPNYFVIPHKDLAEDFYSRKIPRDILLPFGIPVKDCFGENTDKSAARSELGLDANSPILLIMSGSMGFGGLEELAASLSAKFGKDAQIIILCGRNDKMRAQLAQTFDGNHNIILQPFTDKVSLFMDAADMVFTKPGGLSSTEAAAKNILLAHTAPIPDCETINLKFFGDRGMSINGGEQNDVKILADRAYKLFCDKDAQQRMLEAQRTNINPRAAENICNFIIKHFS